ncbi:YlmH/Sll1252 family protein [Clostridium sp. SYSU_GA19001]|uniref:YlmH family RNA-binding protein n=1 Tax=Clostridium caldaquaticum TaxID=2940653 RepID=UPI0020775AF0|nr:YlmH/Sll1252 family protein [Clostridium caldaquaticum]MCM8711015.1 YlmH/Sll1252 family protein [Clostridium caldaquaticum]
MDKKTFLNFINTEDKNLLSNIYDKIKLAEKITGPVFTNEYYGPNIWKAVINLKREFNTGIYAYGVFEDCERRMLSFSKEEVYTYPIKVIKITNKSKFQKLKHKDYLGAVMALGIKREKFGDLIVKDNCCYGAFCEDIAEFIVYNLNSVGKCPCIVEILEEADIENIKVNTEDFQLISTSLRLDSIVSALCNISRAKSVDVIRSGKVLVDYMEVYEKDKLVEFSSTVTIRGYGKYKIVEESGSTQKGRLKLFIRKYI